MSTESRIRSGLNMQLSVPLPDGRFLVATAKDSTSHPGIEIAVVSEDCTSKGMLHTRSIQHGGMHMDLCKGGSGSQDSLIVVYKLIRQLKNGALRSLFIDAKCDRPIGEWLEAEFHPTKGFEPRFGWHCTFLPIAPHLTTKGRVWVEVKLDGEVEFKDRPACQGGRWLLGKGRMMITRILSDDEVRRLQESASDSPQAG